MLDETGLIEMGLELLDQYELVVPELGYGSYQSNLGRAGWLDLVDSGHCFYGVWLGIGRPDGYQNSQP